MKTIRDLFDRDITRKIEEVIKVDQTEESAVKAEIEEYVVTDSIQDHFHTVFKAVADAPSEPHEGIGVWVSGFFGSGKSSFAKILGYTIGARKLLGASATEVFLKNPNTKPLLPFLDVINAKTPTRPVIFDVSMDRGVRKADERIAHLMYTAFLRELGYAEDYDLAELEIQLEGDGKLDDFRRRFQAAYEQPWERRRKLGVALNEASRILHDLDPKTYPSEDSWAKARGRDRSDITNMQFAERAFDLMARRRAGEALLFVIDEVGQYVSRSVDKMLDLQGVVQSFGVVGKNRVKARTAVAPCWIVVTSQEKLNEVVDALGDKKVELARLQDRFPLTIDLKQSDISEVTGRRVLQKSKAAEKALGTLFDRNEGRLSQLCSLESTSRSTSSRVCACAGRPSSTSAGATARSSSRPSRCSSTRGRTSPTNRSARSSRWIASTNSSMPGTCFPPR